jgi:hypothetical protein
LLLALASTGFWFLAQSGPMTKVFVRSKTIYMFGNVGILFNEKRPAPPLVEKETLFPNT